MHGVADDGRDGQVITWGVAIQMAMRYERQKQYMLPAKVGGNGEKGFYHERDIIHTAITTSDNAT